MTKLHAYSIRVILAKLKEGSVPDAEKGEELGEVLSLNAKYALNTIPKAAVTLPVGDKLGKDGLTPSYTNTVDLPALADAHTPVGLYVTVKGTNIDHNIIPKEEFCIFKGYIEGCSYSRNETNATMTVQLAHWLQVLTVFPLVNTMVDPQCVGVLGRSFSISASKQFYTDSTGLSSHTLLVEDNKKRTTNCAFIINALNSLSKWGEDKFDIWAILRKILYDGMPKKEDVKNEEDPGHVSAPVLRQVRYALSAITGKKLTPSDTGIRTDPAIRRGIANYICSLSEQQLSSQTPWDAIISSILPSFYMALVPTANKAYVIPIPGQCMDKKSCLSLTLNDYRSISYNRTTRPMIGGVMLYFLLLHTAQDNSAPTVAYRYPLENKPGPVQFINAPQWISQSTLAAAANEGVGQIGFYDSFKNIQDNIADAAKKQQEELNNLKGGIQRILKALVRSAYQVLSCQGRSCVLVLPFRPDITPGSQIELDAADIMTSGATKKLYGTVSSVSLVVSANAADTVIELNNLRTNAEMDDLTLTSNIGVLFKDAWHHDEGVLYAK